MSVRLVFETRGKCQDFVVRYKDDGIPYSINNPFCCANTTITERQSRSIEERDVGKQFKPLWKELADQLKVLFPNADDEGVFIIPALDARSQVLSIKDRRNGIGKPVFKLASLGSGQTLTFVAPELSVPGISPQVVHLTRHFFSFTARTCNDVWYHIGSSVGARHPVHVSCASVIVCSLPFPLVLFRVFLYLPLLLPEPWLPPFPLPCGCLRSKIPYAFRQLRSLALWPTTPLSQVMSTTSSTISTSQRPLNFSSRSNPATRCPRTCMTRSSVTTPSAERFLHHCSLRSEKNQRTVDKLITLLKKVCCHVSRRLSVRRPVHELSSLGSKSGFSLNDKKSKFSPIFKQRFTNTSSRPIMIEEVSRSWEELLSLNEEKFIVLIKETNNIDEINNLFMNNYWNKIGIFMKLIWKVSMRWKKWSDLKGLHSMAFREEDWSKIETLSLNSQPRFRNYRMKLIVWKIRETLKMLNQYAVDNSTLPVNQRFSHVFQILAEC